MAVLLTTPAVTGTSGYTLLIADTAAQVAAAQRLRYTVFVEEFGAKLSSPVPGLDVDEFDAHCEHLIVREDRTGAVVGTYRMLPPDRVAQAGGRYAEAEFDLTPLAPLRDGLVEIGRSCVDPAHRSGAVINLMWAGIARYLHLRGLRWLAGCGSVPLGDGGATAVGVWAEVQRRHLSPPPMRVRPHRPWLAEPSGAAALSEVSPGEAVASRGRVPMPPLLRGYLRLGAWVCGEPAYDPAFDSADFYVLFSLDRMPDRYRRHFLGPDQ
ncbi:GNAT family N-acetyltransferase [Plantactinospora sp. S1510]|uniref:GNAT family N-acetyltransferase n=1 Tax=Plantactinospora alkalitolerans TaxID=2789879 RepID=A0ABS0H9R6_9ACTN|nr:GNAT family N-acetyltransferase [Plantactinospora alkalitolerans]MBF9134889.1 GNAT family N-acetyltransferase [Plantactinospora alkalitolerans]